jgi:hypothetical protein
MSKTMLLIALLVLPATVTAQSAESATRDSVIGVAKALFDGMRSHDAVLLGSVFADGAMLSEVPKAGEPIEFSPAPGFVASASRSGQPWDEKIYDPIVQIDGDLASLWVFYTFSLGDKLSHCGYDNFQMTRLEGEWKISFLSDTRRKTDCEVEGMVEVK